MTTWKRANDKQKNAAGFALFPSRREGLGPTSSADMRGAAYVVSQAVLHPIVGRVMAESATEKLAALG